MRSLPTRIFLSLVSMLPTSHALCAPVAEGISDDSSDLSQLSQELHDGAVSFDVAFPGGGSVTGTNAIGARMFFSPTFATGVYGQFSYDNASSMTAYGATLRVQNYVHSRTRANLYLFAQASAGKNRRGEKSETSLSETEAGGAAGFGVEIFLIPELSTSVDLGLGGTFLPSSRSSASTGTSQIALHYFLGEE